MGSCLEWRIVMSKYSKLWEYIKNMKEKCVEFVHENSL